LNAASRGNLRLLLWMPALFALWANLHGGWLVGLGTLGLWSAGALLTGTMSWPWAVGGFALAAFGTLATPYGVGLWAFLWETVGLGRGDITEWQPLAAEPVLLIPWTAVASLSFVAWWRRRSAALPLLIPTAALGILSLRVSRLDGFFALTSVALLAPCFAAFGPERLPLSKRPTRADLATVGAVCVLALAAATFAMRGWAGCLTIPGPGSTESWAPDAESVTFLRTNPIQGRLLSYFSYGEMAIWHLAPKFRVSYDGRRETVFSEAVREAHLNFYSKTPDAGYANRVKADYIWLPRRLPVIDLLLKDGWIAIFGGTQSVVLARRAGMTYVQPPPWAGPRCFPGP
jgi:hypothetical protein